MVFGGEGLWEPLEQWSPTLFLAGGAIVVAFAVVEGYGILVAGDPAHFQDLRSAFLVGYVLGFVGLLGVYPSLVERTPWLARLGATCAALGAMGFSVAVLLGLSRLAGIGPSREALPAWLGIAVGLLPLFGFLLGYLSFGVGSLRSNAHSQSFGLLLLTPTVLFILIIVLSILGVSPWTGPVLAGGIALTLLVIGRRLRTGVGSTEQTEFGEHTA